MTIGLVQPHQHRIIKAINLYNLLLVFSNQMSESECKFCGLLRHKYTVDVHFYPLLSVLGNVELFMSD